MVYGKTVLATDFTDEAMQSWRVRLIDALLFFVPHANPDHEPLYPLVRSWALELSDDFYPQREVALDATGHSLFRSPDTRNTGFWPDMAYAQLEVTDVDQITQAEFDSLWAEAPQAESRNARASDRFNDGTTRRRGIAQFIVSGALFAAWVWWYARAERADEYRVVRIIAFYPMLFPGAYAFAGLIQAVTGVSFSEWSSRWNSLKRWQRGWTVFLVFALGTACIFGGLAILGLYFNV
jgi:hypothetical protein